MRIRRKGVAIVESTKGILVVSGRSKVFALPGGGADRGESRRRAAIRELREETGLKAHSAKQISYYEGRVWRDHRKRRVQNHTKVYKVKAYGRARPRHEIKHIAWWKPTSRIRISQITKHLIDEYYKQKKSKESK